MPDVIQRSYDRIAPHAPGVMEALYRRLFERMPETRAMFPGAMSNQYGKFAATLQLCVMEEAHPNTIDTLLERLGRKHDLRGVAPIHFPVFIDCFVEAMAEQLGADWTDDLERAWRRAMTDIAGRMAAVSDQAKGAA